MTIPLRREDKCILCKNKKLAMCLVMIHWQIPVLHYSVFSGRRTLPFPSIRKVVLPATLAELYIQNNISRLFASTICIACQPLIWLEKCRSLTCGSFGLRPQAFAKKKRCRSSDFFGRWTSIVSGTYPALLGLQNTRAWITQNAGDRVSSS